MKPGAWKLTVPLMVLAVCACGAALAQGNLDAGSEAEDDSVMTDSDQAAARESELIRGGSSPLVVPAAEFTDDGFDPDSVFFAFGGGYFGGTSAAYGCLEAPVYLPDGVTVTDLFASVYDNDASRNITVSLRKVNNFTGTATTMAAASSSGTAVNVYTIVDSSIDSPTISYPDHSVYTTTCVSSSENRIYSVRVYYTP